MNLKKVDCARSNQISSELANLKSKYGKLTAERLYRKFTTSNINAVEIMRFQNLFSFKAVYFKSKTATVITVAVIFTLIS
jgi:hypothetical protein